MTDQSERGPSESPSPADEIGARKRLERLLQAGLAIAAEHATEGVLQRVVDAARSVVGARYAALGVIDETGTALDRFVVSGLTEEEQRRIGALPRGHGLLGVLIRDARPVRLARIADDPRRHGFPPNHPPMHSFLGVPVTTRGKVFGNLYLTEKIGAPEFSADDEAIAEILAAQAAEALDSAQLVERQEALLRDRQTLQRQRDQFFAMINHELRNALTGVYGWAEQLQRSKTEEGVRRASREIYEAAERTIVLMNNLLDLSRLDAGSVQLALREYALQEIVDTVIRQLTPAAQAKRLLLTPDLTRAPATLTTDRMKLEQVLLNLLSNAIRHSPAEAPIAITAERLADELLLSVSDLGPGVAEQDQQKIFEPFIRVDPESGIGSGLGLPVARRLTELMGGRLSLHSHPGRGATFTVALPLRMA